MSLIRLLPLCAARHNIHVMVTHIAGTDNSIADALSRFQVHRFWQLAPLAASQPDSISAWPAHFFVSYNTIKVYLGEIRLEHIERSFPHPTQHELLHLLCTGIKKSQGSRKRTRLPITISILRTLKTQLKRDTSFSLLERYLLWAALTLAFYGFLRSSEFATTELTWSDLQMQGNHYSLTIQQSKTDPFCRGPVLTLHESQTSTCPVKAMSQFIGMVVEHQRQGPLSYGWHFTPLNRHKLTATLRSLLQPTSYNKQHFASHSFRIGAATTAAAASLPVWLIKPLGRWSSDAYETYIQPGPLFYQSIPQLLAKADTSQ